MRRYKGETGFLGVRCEGPGQMETTRWYRESFTFGPIPRRVCLAF